MSIIPFKEYHYWKSDDLFKLEPEVEIVMILIERGATGRVSTIKCTLELNLTTCLLHLQVPLWIYQKVESTFRAQFRSSECIIGKKNSLFWCSTSLF